ncbi:GntR family transcriptional regulator [Mycoplasmatota bacterium]|nr:GntR family transcriptional regulator [Mycoplasmatota bacterium]
MDYIIIDKTSKIPLYIQISDSIRHHIELGVLKHGTKLPTESMICYIYEISSIVVKKAYEDLVQKNLVKRIRGKGTYVNTKKPYVLNLNKGLLSLTALLDKTKRVVLSFDKLKHYMAHQWMDIDPNENIFVAKIITKYKNEPILYNYIFFPEKFFPNLRPEHLRKFSTLDLISSKYQLKPKKIRQIFHPVTLPSDISELLDIQKDSPGYLIRSYIENQHHEKLAYYTIYTASEYIEFEVTAI